MPRRVFNILFVCTGNSARSIIAEAYLNNLKLPHLRAYSAGARPLGKVNPFALDALNEAGIPTNNLRSKSWDEFLTADAPKMDLVINLCEDPDSDPCPAWPGKPATANWAIRDPVAAEGAEVRRRGAFMLTLANLKQRIDFLQHRSDEQLTALSTRVSRGLAK